jgi:hypothetical protein
MKDANPKTPISPEAALVRDRIRELLKQRDLTYSQAAEAMKISQATFKRMMSRGGFTLDGLIDLSRWLKMPLKELIADLLS